MNETLFLLLVFLVSMVVHELGHYIAFRMNGIRKPKIRLHWWGVSIGSEEDMDALTLRESIDVFVTGIIFGYCVILVATIWWDITNPALVFAYLLACFIDFSSLYQIISVLKKHPELRNVRMNAANLRLAREIILLAKQKD